MGRCRVVRRLAWDQEIGGSIPSVPTRYGPRSSDGRALASQARGRGFNPRRVHHSGRLADRYCAGLLSQGFPFGDERFNSSAFRHHSGFSNREWSPQRRIQPCLGLGFWAASVVTFTRHPGATRGAGRANNPQAPRVLLDLHRRLSVRDIRRPAFFTLQIIRRHPPSFMEPVVRNPRQQGL